MRGTYEVSSFFVVGLTLSSAAAHAVETIEIVQPVDPARVVTYDRIAGAMGGMDREVVASARSQVAASEFIDGVIKNAILGSIDELPFHRLFDDEVAFLSGFPDLIALCLEGHPVRGLAIEACASTLIIVASVSANVKYRWALVPDQTARGRIHQLSAGPGFGVNAFWAAGCFDGCSTVAGAGPIETITADAMGSLEYVYWIGRHFGLTPQLDLGASYVHYLDDDKPVPTGKFTIGLAF